MLDWEESLEDYPGIILASAHCDNRVLHEPGLCKYCDQYPEAQARRVELGINFTGGRDDTLKPCPAERARGTVSLYGWGGNQPRNEDMDPEYKQALKDLERPESRIFYGDN